MKGCINNQLFVVENDGMRIYQLDDRRRWLIGRRSGKECPDICMSSSTVSRTHGEFYNEEGVWFFRNLSTTNGTHYMRRNLKKPPTKLENDLMLQDGDVLFPGNGTMETDGDSAWILFSECDYGSEKVAVDTSEYKRLLLYDEEKQVELECPQPGTTVWFSGGIAIYMGRTTYLIGTVSMKQL